MTDFAMPAPYDGTSQGRPATDPPPFTAAALALAVLSLFTWWLPPVGGALALIALVLSWIGARSARVHPERYVVTMAPTATRVVAGIGLVFAAGMMVVWLAIAAAVGAASGAEPGHEHHRHGLGHGREGHEGEDAKQLW